jgi:hypothetical protein
MHLSERIQHHELVGRQIEMGPVESF